MKKLILTAFLILMMMLAGCTETPDATLKTITPQEAIEIMANTDHVIILDVRELHEFNEGHIPNAVSLPIGEIKDAVPHMIPNKNDIILVYCRTGRRSADAAEILSNLGYTRVYDFGGIVHWPGEVY